MSMLWRALRSWLGEVKACRRWAEAKMGRALPLVVLAAVLLAAADCGGDRPGPPPPPPPPPPPDTIPVDTIPPDTLPQDTVPADTVPDPEPPSWDSLTIHPQGAAVAVGDTVHLYAVLWGSDVPYTCPDPDGPWVEVAFGVDRVCGLDGGGRRPGPCGWTAAVPMVTTPGEC